MIVSLITVVFNNAKNLSETIESVLEQDYLKNIEYIVIDGGSTDGTLDIIKEYQKMISVFVSEPDDGIYDGLNKGVSYATGDIVGFIHSGDLFAHKGVVTQIAKTFNNENSDVVYGDIDYVKKNDVTSVVRHWRSGCFSAKKLSYGWMPPHLTLYIRKELYEQFGVFDTSYEISADYDYMLRLLSEQGLIVLYIPEVLVKMRVGGVSNILKKSLEDYRALKSNHVGSIIALIWKNLSKISQFFVR